MLSNRFEVFQPLVDNQEQKQQISYESSASVQPVFSTKNKVQRKKVSKNDKDTIKAQVDDNYKLTLAHQDKKLFVGNKNETGLFDGESRDVITSSYQSWSVADSNTHVPNLEQMLTRNYYLNSIKHENSCSQKFGLNQNKQTAIYNHNEQCKSQTGGNFGFVPQTNLKLYDGESVYWEKVPDVIHSHYIVRDSGLPNFLKARIPVNTIIKI